ncbi:AfsR/SARP family transcriptional regulator [Streptomyces sp. TRM68367]|uniref:AfsR/SARP family transcriptional regulator n=1 Tax=Streptomyces sp. TRM68367 TaxID=2758415 RepID=UPI00165C3E5C|nr:AfsR/SARP family transcriptional regulator [Streptomyces sp. TRM68367]MBC9727078.1 AfsR/SARP family transcriptional regulator [Streptomyces sp. TRM68367]
MAQNTGECAFRLLGPIEVSVGDRVLELRGLRQRALLTRLLLAQGRVVSVDALAHDVWSGNPPRSARTQVSICVAALRRLFRDAGASCDVITTVTPGYRLELTSHWTDIAEFSARTEKGYDLARRGLTEQAAEQLHRALALWRGRAFGDLTSHFTELEAAHLSQQRMLATEQLMMLRLELGEHRSLVGELTALVGANPLREQLRACLMLALHRSGQRAEALRTFREGRALTVDELGLEPGADLRAVHEQILHDEAEPSASADGHCANAPWQAAPPAQLPSDSAVFCGRREELRRLDQVLGTDTSARTAPVACVVGPPGTGKSAVVVHWGHRAAARFPDGCLYVDLRETTGDDPGRTAQDVLRRFLRALGVPPASLPDGLEECAALYRSLIAGRRLLIVLDHARCYDQIRPLLPGDGLCRVVVTGCELLMDKGTAEVVLLGGLAQGEAVRLLAETAGADRIAADPIGAATLVGLCARLPVALRAAGARLARKPHWTVADLVGRMSDRSRRLDLLSQGENSVRACFDRALHTLPFEVAGHYRALGRLSASAFNTGIAADVLGLGGGEAEDALERLVDLHLLEVVGRDPRGALRYRFPGLLALHAAEAYAARPDAPTRRGELALAAPQRRHSAIQRHGADRDATGS